MTPDDALAEVRRRAAGRTRYEGQPRPVDELLAEEVERLRAALREIAAPTYGTEIHDTDAELAETYWRHLSRMQAVARRALGDGHG